LAYVRLGESQQAEEAFQRVRHHQDQVRQLNQLNELAIARPRDPNVRHRLGQVCVELGKPELAEMWFRAALMLDPYHSPTHRSLVEFYKKAKLPERANWHARKAGLPDEVATP
jgi:predicted Zn-dependent protease